MSSSVNGIDAFLERNPSVEITGPTTSLPPSETSTKISNRYDMNEREFLFELLKRDVFGAFYEACLTRKQEDGFSRKDLAERTERDKTGVSKLLKSPGNWTLKTISDFANALDLDAKLILCDRKYLSRYFDRTGLHFDDAVYKNSTRSASGDRIVIFRVENKSHQLQKKINNGKDSMLSMHKKDGMYCLSVSNRMPSR